MKADSNNDKGVSPMRKLSIIRMSCFILLLASQCSLNNPEIKIIKNGIELSKGKNNLKVQFYSERIARIIKWHTAAGTSARKSLSVIQDTLAELGIKVEENGNEVFLKSKFSCKFSTFSCSRSRSLISKNTASSLALDYIAFCIVCPCSIRIFAHSLRCVFHAYSLYRIKTASFFAVAC